MTRLEPIAIFIKVVEENGFTSAAKQLGISTAAVSKHITALEKALGVVLIQRSTRRLSLTEVGEQYYTHCKQALRQLSEAENLILHSKTEPQGLLNITANRYFANKYLLPKLADFLNLYPKLDLRLELAERFPDLMQEGIDILFGVSLQGPLNLVCKRITTTRYVLCASPGYLNRHGTPKVTEELKQHVYLTHTMRQPSDVIQLKHQAVRVQPHLWLNDAFTLLQCALQDMGIVMLHEYMVSQALADGSLVELLPEYTQSALPVYMYYQPSRYLLPKIRCFVDFYFSKL